MELSSRFKDVPEALLAPGAFCINEDEITYVGLKNRRIGKHGVFNMAEAGLSEELGIYQTTKSVL